MLTNLQFKNFKAWKDSGPIRLAPLTVLFGANSAGKTSIPQLLLLLKQTAASPDRKRALQLGDERTPVDLGTYSDMVHRHAMDQAVELEFEWTLAAPLKCIDPLTKRSFDGDSIRFQVRIEADRRHQPRVESFQYVLLRDRASVLEVGVSPREGTRKFDLVSKGYTLRRQTGRPWPLNEPLRFYGFPDEVIAHYQNTAFTSDLVLEMERMLQSIFYVGPLREYPKRLYLWSGEVPDHVGMRGDRAIEAILAAGPRRFNWRPKQHTKTLPELVAGRLKDMGLINSFRIEPLGEHRKEYEVLVKTHARAPEVKLTDVGFGVSPVLPVIVECLYVPRRSIVIFEQPEIHLHPRVQADLADLFVDAVRARQDGEARDCQFIVESHSEHFLRRLQRRIAEGELSAHDAALYFVDGTREAARIEELDVDRFGSIRNWPRDFFGDEMGDLVARREAQALRMAKQEEA